MNKQSQSLAVFPVGHVFFPGGILSLRIVEPQHLKMVKHCMRNNEPFVVSLIRKDQTVEEGEVPPLHRHGTLAYIVDFELLDGGVLGISCRGGGCAEIDNYSIQESGIIMGDIVEVEPQKALLVDYKGELDYKPLLGFIKRVMANDIMADYRERMTQDWGNVCWIGCRLSELLPLPQTVKQSLLELPTLERFEEVGRIMNKNNLL